MTNTTTETKDDEGAVSPDQISEAKAQAVDKLFQDAFNARNNVQGLKNQKAMILQRNAGLQSQFEEYEKKQAQSHESAKASDAKAEALDGEVQQHRQKLDEMKKGVTGLEKAIKAAELAKLQTVGELTQQKDKLAGEVAEAQKEIDEKKKTYDEHRATAQEHRDAAAVPPAGANDHANDAMQQLAQIEHQINFNEQQSEQKQKQAEEQQAMSDNEWFAVPDNRKAVKGLLDESQKAAMDKEDKASIANAKKMADTLVPDAEVKTLQSLVAHAKVGYQVAGRLPDGFEGQMEAGEAMTAANGVDTDYQKIDQMRSRLAGEAEAADEGDDATKEKFKEEALELKNMVRDFKTKYGAGVNFNFSKMLPENDDMDELVKQSQDLAGAKSPLLPLVGAKNIPTARAALAKFGNRWTTMKASTKGVTSGTDKKDDTWAQKVYQFVDQVTAFNRDVPLYKAKLTELSSVKDANTAMSLLAEADKLGSG